MLKVIKLVVIMGLMHCGFTSSRVISTLYALDHQESAWVVGAILSAYSLIPALIAIHVGKWIDKVGVKLPFGIAASMVGSASLVPVFLPYESFGIWPVFITCLLAGTGFLFALISGQGLIGVLSTNKTRATAFTYQSIAFSLSGSAGPVIAGYFIDLGSFSYAYLAAFSFATVGGLAFFLLSSNFPKNISNISKLKRTEKHSALELFALKPVRNVLIASAFVSMAWDLQAFMIPVYGTEIGLDAVQIGWLLSAFSISTFAVRTVMPIISKAFEEWKIIIFVLTSSGLIFLVFPFIHSLPLLFVFVSVLGMSIGSSQPNVLSLLHTVTPDGRIGEAIGIRTMLMNLSHCVFPLLFGAGGSLVGAAAAFWSLGGTLLAGAGYLRASNKNFSSPTST